MSDLRLAITRLGSGVDSRGLLPCCVDLVDLDPWEFEETCDISEIELALKDNKQANKA